MYDKLILISLYESQNIDSKFAIKFDDKSISWIVPGLSNSFEGNSVIALLFKYKFFDVKKLVILNSITNYNNVTFCNI